MSGQIDHIFQHETHARATAAANKTIIRRSGENIAAAEVEATLLGREAVAEIAVVAIADPVRRTQEESNRRVRQPDTERLFTRARN